MNRDVYNKNNFNKDLFLWNNSQKYSQIVIYTRLDDE